MSSKAELTIIGSRSASNAAFSSMTNFADLVDFRAVFDGPASATGFFAAVFFVGGGVAVAVAALALVVRVVVVVVVGVFVRVDALVILLAMMEA